ncbi:hypothetical protein TRFO_27429 [Tritrichomonas foetus]|uniref:Uncharacterized protein n=1 Tax=Tritrichomonas foetus TaxID=1144522 RepID=A0A1J4K682_9EUKA|nr:hypothetical protein TRFO_27429 [Tritrichomonas foetus]|eukprot:OHT04981.1 hypothetical protein TRFO_27429 [Tritrichomonas foetus]
MIFDSISESETNIHNNDGKNEDSEMQLIAESRGIHLQQINESLQKENSKLRAQFEEAVRVNSQIDDLHKKIQSLTNEIFDLKSQKEDLSQRLEIALHANDELTIKFEDQKESLHEQRKSDLLSLQTEIQRTQRKLKNEEDKNHKMVEKYDKEIDKLTVENKTNQNYLQRIISGAEHYFEQSFHNTEDLIKYLNQPPLRVQETQDNFHISSSITVKNKQIAEIEKQKKRVLQKLDKAHAKNKELAHEIISLEKEHSSQIYIYTDKIEELNMLLQQQKEEHSLIDEGNKHKIDVLNSKIAALSSEIQQNKLSQITSASISSKSSSSAKNSVSDDSSQLPIGQLPRITQLEEELEDLTVKHNEITEKLNIMTEKYEDTILKLKENEEENDKLKKGYDKVFNDLNALKLVHQNSITENQMLRTALRSKDDPKVIETKKEKIKKLQNHIRDLERQLQEKENFITEQTIDFEEKIHNFDNDKLSLKADNERLKTEINSLNEKIKKLNDEVGSSKLTSQFYKEQNSNNFSNNYFPQGGQMNSSPYFIPQNGNNPFYDSYNNNENLQQNNIGNYETKMITSKRCKCKLEEAIQKAEQATKEKEEIDKKFTTILSSLTSMLSLTAKQAESPEECVSELQNFVKSHEALKHEHEAFNNALIQLATEFDISKTNLNNDFSIIICELREKLKKQKCMIQKRKKQISQLKKATNLLKDQSFQLEKDSKEQQSELVELKSSMKEIESKNSKMKRLIHSQKQQLQNYYKIHEEQESSTAKHVDKLVNARKEVEYSFREQINDLNMKIANLRKQTDDCHSEIELYKETIRNQKATIVELQLKLGNRQKEGEENEYNWKSSSDKEKTRQEKVITELQQNLENARNDLEKISKQLTAANKKLKQAKNYCLQAKLEKEKLQQEIESQRERLEREKQITETESKASVLKAESDYTAKLDEQKGKWEKDKRRYFSFVADQFRQFFNPQDSIDEKSFRDVVSRARDELIRLNAIDSSVRRLVGADNRQKTEDAVAQIVMNS